MMELRKIAQFSLVGTGWRVLVLGVSIAWLGGCGRTPDLSLSPEPVPDDGYLASLAEPVIDDSAADEAALSAIRDLEFHSLTKGGQRVRGTIPVPVPEDFDLDGSHLHRGGMAAAGSRFDIDVESFLSHRRVQYYVDYFSGPARGRFSVWLARMTKYRGMIQNHFRVYGLPEDLVYLALIESGYSNTAVSRASAVGMWQFIASTGRRYGLRVDDWVDERRDPFKATDAAARYLADLKDEFGAWYLAAAAYNAGPSRVSRGLSRLKGASSYSDTTFFELSSSGRYLRLETRDYVPKLIAATLIAENPEGHGFEDGESMDPLLFDEITVPGQTSLDVLARLADTTDRALQELNPEFYRGVTPPNESATVRVPRGRGNQVMHGYANLAPEDRVSFIEHRIRRGETLSVIAQRYRIRLRDLELANPGLHPKRLRVGQRLTIPLSPSARQSASAPRSRTSPAEKRVTRQVAPPASGTHRVRLGDSLWIVAQRFGITVDDLRKWNGIPENVTLLRVGDTLQVVPPSSN